MKACGLGDVDAVKDQYTRYMIGQLEQQFGKPIREIVKEDPSLDQTVMGSANFLQMYCNFHPTVAFILTYTNTATGKPADWVITGGQAPLKVARIAHTGSVDGGHFTARNSEPFDVVRATQVWRTRSP